MKSMGSYFLLLLWKLIIFASFIVKESSSEQCHKETEKAEPCPPGWDETSRPRSCIKFFPDEKVSWWDAHRVCQSKAPDSFSDLISISNGPQYDHFKKITKNRYHGKFWTGGNNIYPVGYDGTRKSILYSKFPKQYDLYQYWSNFVMNHLSTCDWEKWETAVFKRRCITFTFDDTLTWTKDVCNRTRPAVSPKWKYESCDLTLPIICQTEANTGPREITIDPNYHRGDGIYYKNYPIHITCSAFYPERGRLRHIDFMPDSILHWKKLPNITRAHSLEMTSTGLCGNKSMLHFQIEKATSDLINLTYTCHSHKETPYETYVNCHPNMTKLAFCKRLQPFKIIDGPKARPNLTITSDNRDGSVTNGDRVQVECSVITGYHSKLTWVVHLKDDTRRLNEDVEKIVKRIVDRDLYEDRTEVQTVEFIMSPSLDGISLICFAHDVFKYNMKTLCDNSNELFCSETTQFRVASGGKKFQAFKVDGNWQYWIPGIVFTLLVFLIPVGCRYFMKYDGEEDTGGAVNWVKRATSNIVSKLSLSKTSTAASFSDMRHPPRLPRARSTTIL